MTTAQYAKEHQLQREVSRTVEQSLPGVEVLALELTGTDKICVFVDHPQGVDHALCERVTNALWGFLDEYSVEVSSPGIDRPLRRRAHFERALGSQVKVRTEQLGTMRGEVLSAGEKSVQIESKKGPVEIPYDDIVRANLIEEG